MTDDLHPWLHAITEQGQEISMSKAELCALRRQNQQWHDIWAKTEAKRQELEAANTALRSIAADLEDVQRRCQRLEAENAALLAAAALQDALYADRPGTLFSARQKIAAERDALRAENARLRATFGPQTAADLPDRPRRPDGTLAPQPNPLPVLKTHEPSRMVGRA